MFKIGDIVKVIDCKPSCGTNATLNHIGVVIGKNSNNGKPICDIRIYVPSEARWHYIYYYYEKQLEKVN